MYANKRELISVNTDWQWSPWSLTPVTKDVRLECIMQSACLIHFSISGWPVILWTVCKDTLHETVISACLSLLFCTYTNTMTCRLKRKLGKRVWQVCAEDWWLKITKSQRWRRVVFILMKRSWQIQRMAVVSVLYKSNRMQCICSMHARRLLVWFRRHLLECICDNCKYWNMFLTSLLQLTNSYWAAGETQSRVMSQITAYIEQGLADIGKGKYVAIQQKPTGPLHS